MERLPENRAHPIPSRAKNRDESHDLSNFKFKFSLGPAASRRPGLQISRFKKENQNPVSLPSHYFPKTQNPLPRPPPLRQLPFLLQIGRSLPSFHPSPSFLLVPPSPLPTLLASSSPQALRMDPRISYGSNKENVAPVFPPSASKHGLRPSLPLAKCNKVVRRRKPLEDITHLFVHRFQFGAARSRFAYSIDRDLVSSGGDVLFCFRYGGGLPRRVSQAKTKAPVTQRSCRLSLRKSFR